MGKPKQPKPNDGLSFQEYEQQTSTPAPPSQPTGARELQALQDELDELRAGARTGLLRFMMAGDAGRYVDRARQFLQVIASNADNKATLDAARNLDAVLSALFQDAVEKTKDTAKQTAAKDADNKRLMFAMRDAERERDVYKQALEKLAKGNRAPGVLEIARAALKTGKEPA